MSQASDIFPESVHDKLFKTESGDVCLCLHEVWPALLADLGLLGPAMLISRSEQLAVVSLGARIEFEPIPGGTEMLDLTSGVLLDTQQLHAVLAGQEAQTGHLHFHFFDPAGRGVFKVVLAPGADLEGFARLVEDYAKRPPSANTWRPSRPCLTSNNGALLTEERLSFQQAWPAFDPALGGEHLPGGHGVCWLDALRLAGRNRALFLTKVGLVKAILAAHHEQLPLRITAWGDGLHHQTTVNPRRIERCGRGLHVFDVESEAHFFLEPELDIWVGLHGAAREPAIHLFNAQGRRRGLIQLAKGPAGPNSWDAAFFSRIASGS